MIIEFNGKKPDISRALFVAENATLVGDVVLEEGATVWYGAVLRGDTGPIHIGRGSNVQDNCVVHCDEGGHVEIGDHVLIGHNAIIHGCTIREGCMIGMGSIVMNNAEIGAYSLVGAGAIVTEGKVFPERSLLLGSPARVVKKVTEEQIQMMQAGTEEYVELGKIYGGTEDSTFGLDMI